ncbi:putative EF-hand domain pair protein CML [Helianthus annuus]|nr:putative EF-hand domain pair protein CML [Helianthus annuus]
MSSKSFFSFKYGGSKKGSIPKTAPPVQSSPVVFQPNADELRWVFDKFDKNKDGKISKEEYVSAVDILGSKTAKTECVEDEDTGLC